MAKITVEVPEVLVGDIYMAVGRVLRDGQAELDEAAKGLSDGDGDGDGDDELAEQS